MTESQKWAAFDIAEIRLDLMISHFDDLISHAQRRSICTAEQIARWQLEHDKLVQAKAVVTLDDQATIEWINSTYGSIVQTILQRKWHP
ncbi:hypothetical protein FBY03_101425 [Pseudomonas sp. SJZ079]|uniref:hypothetical protein n=1 Tax=Pseudomonas sp. SJZ079 TaxID=2572887 RepID=UPI00119C392E|nr:hypothetical protein [Pseudomonas sp. SJZ079]TWC43229.1 hypothetical protein FBY03_101425 [Pseudomonas sp. SJZ079]